MQEKYDNIGEIYYNFKKLTQIGYKSNYLHRQKKYNYITDNLVPRHLYI